jgi:hypothetical protein
MSSERALDRRPDLSPATNDPLRTRVGTDIDANCYLEVRARSNRAFAPKPGEKVMNGKFRLALIAALVAAGVAPAFAQNADGSTGGADCRAGQNSGENSGGNSYYPGDYKAGKLQGER